MVTFKYKKTGAWINFSDVTGKWYLSDVCLNEEENVYEYINEIMKDLKCQFKDIQIIETKN
jgi:hypothetical protein